MRYQGSYHYAESMICEDWLGSFATAEDHHAGGLEAILKYIKDDCWPRIEEDHDSDQDGHDECVEGFEKDENYECYSHECCAAISFGAENIAETLWEKICLAVGDLR